MKLLPYLSKVFALFILAYAHTSYAQIIKENWPDQRVGILIQDATGDLFIAKNNEKTDITLTINISAQNMVCDKKLPYTAIVPAESSVHLCSITPADTRKRWRYSYRWQWRHGTPNAKHNSETVYVIPYEQGKKYTLTHAYSLKTSKMANEKTYLYWLLPIGTPIYAARGGVVIATAANFSKGGRLSTLTDKANYIKIRHSDGTIAQYYHLNKNGVKVEAGQEVKQGELIGHSGKTGNTSRPGLSFSVYRPITGDKVEYYPIKFLQAKGKAILLPPGKIIPSYR